MESVRRKRIAAAITSMLLLVSQSAGAEINKLTCEDYETGEWRVQGSFHNVTDQGAALEVLKPGKTVNDDDPYAYITEVTIDGQGRFDDKFFLNGLSGEYLLRVGAGGQLFEKSFVFINNYELRGYLSSINQASSPAEIEELFEKDYGRLKNICAVRIEPGNKAFVYSSVYNAIPQNGFSDFGEVKRCVAETALLSEFMNADQDKAAALEKLFEFFEDFYMPAVEIWNDASISDSMLKEGISVQLQGMGAGTIEKLQQEFAEQTLIQALSVNGSKGRELKIVKAAHSLIPMDEYSYFSSLSEAQQISILADIPTGHCASVSAYANALDKAIKDFQKKKETSHSPNTGGSTGKTSGVVSIDNSVSGMHIQEPDLNIGGIGQPFTDLDAYDWARISIESLHNNQVVQGKAEGIFAPGDNITREEFTAMIIKALGFEDKAASYNGFEDVKTEDWFYCVIASAVERELIAGISDTEFGVGRNIIRQDAVLICKRAVEALGIALSNNEKLGNLKLEYQSSGEAPFTDRDDISDYAKDAVNVMSRAGLIVGNENNEFKPANNMTRAEAAVLIHSLIQLKNAEQIEVSEKDSQMFSEMKAFGLYDGDISESLGQEISRGEAAKLLCDILDVIHVKSAGYSFSDCGVDNEYADAVYTVCELGLMSADGNRFRTEYSLAYDDAVKMAVSSLGAGKIIEFGGENYINIASSKGILNGVARTKNNGITKKDFLKLFYNLLDENVYKLEMSSNEYRESMDETFLSSWRSIYKDNGKVTANTRAGINAETICGAGYIKIGSTEFRNSNKEYDAYIGREVTYYYRETSSEYELIYMKQRARTKIMTLTSEELDSFSNMEYTYTPADTNKERKLKITNQANVIYNTQNLYEYTEDQLIPKSGTVTFVDADGDGKYTKEDTIIIQSYKDVVVGGIDVTNEIIYDKYAHGEDNDYELNLGRMEAYEIKDQHGDTFGLRELREWDVLAALVSPDGRYADITLVDEAFGGKITQVSYEENETQIRLDGKEYEFAKEWRGDLNTLKVGDKVTIYVDLFGKVAAVQQGIASTAVTEGETDNTALTEKLAVLLDTIHSEEELDLIKIYYADNKFTRPELAEKVSINAKKYRSDEALVILEDYIGKAILIRQDTKGRIKEIVTAAPIGTDRSRGLWLMTYENESLVYKSNVYSFGNRFIAKENYYTIPQDRGDYNDISKFGFNKARFDNDKSYVLDAYTTTWLGVNADAVVYPQALAASGNYDSDTTFVISDIIQTINADDEPVLRIQGFDIDYWTGVGSAKSFDLDKEAILVDVLGNKREDMTIDDVERGDTIRYGLSGDKINTIMLAYDCSESIANENPGDRSGFTWYGYAYSLSEDEQYLTMTDGTLPSQIKISSYEEGGRHLRNFWIRTPSMITVVERNNKNVRIRSGSPKDIMAYTNVGNGCSKVVVMTNWQSYVISVIVYV